MYNIPITIPIHKAKEQIIEETQICLLHLHLLPYTSRVDSVLSNSTMSALMVPLNYLGMKI